jgi:hypothetical protein
VGTKGRFAIDLAGQRFGKVTAAAKAGVKGGHMHWLIRCDCGVEKVVSGNSLRRGSQKSCGCGIRTHNLSRSSTYKSWQMMHQRCSNPANGNYQRYGAKGISICSRWDRFENFLEDLGERPIGTSLDRIDSSGNYEPSNCRWATREQQNVNTTRWAGYRSIDGERISVRAMAHILAMPEHILRSALGRTGAVNGD